MAAPVRLLLSGDVNGRFNKLFARVAAVNKSSGPFDLLLCTGSFFPAEGQSEQEKQQAILELKDYTSGSKLPPVPTYFIGASGADAPQLLALIDDPSSKADLQYLGTSGLRKLGGLSIAFLDANYGEADLKALQSEVAAADGDVDILLTCTWPSKITSLCAPGAVPEGLAALGNEAIAQLARGTRPRYHVAGGTNAFFARVPYLNKDLGAGSHATRFIGLAPVGNADKQKSLHALGLQPAASMDPAALQQRPAGTTPSPYEAAAKRPVEEGNSGQDWRWDANKRQRTAEPSHGRPGVIKDSRKTIYVRNLPYAATEDDVTSFFSACGVVADYHRSATDGKLHGWAFVQFETVEAAERACQLPEASLMGRELFIDAAGAQGGGGQPSGAPVEGCWFCLSSEKADLDLVVSVGEEMYVALDKGPINPQHALVLPIEHRPNSLELSAPAYSELERYLSALRSCYASKGMEMLAFERFLMMKSRGGNHMQVNAVAIPGSAAGAAQQAVLRAAEEHNISMKEVAGAQTGEAARAALREAVGTGEFFQILLPGGTRLVHAVAKSQRHPVAFGREVAAALAGAPQRADWRECKIGEAEGRKMAEAFKELFKPYDIMD